jgi:hypothetical protein
MEIRINSQPWKENNLTTRHTHARRAPRVAIVHDAVNESGWVLPRPSAIFHANASAATPCVVQTLSHCTPVKHGKVSSNSVPHNTTQFVGPHESCMCQYTTQSLLIRTQSTRALIDSGGGYHLEAPNFRSDHSPSFPSSILRFPLIAPRRLPLCQHGNHLTIST